MKDSAFTPEKHPFINIRIIDYVNLKYLEIYKHLLGSIVIESNFGKSL